MKTFIFSKQCDYDRDLFDFWHRWYTEIFKADRILITPVKTERSEIEETCRYYREKGLEVSPIEIPAWNDNTVWDEQKKLAAAAAGGEQYVFISADADQYFQPLDGEIRGEEVVFRRIFLFSDSTPTAETLAGHDLWGFAAPEYSAGFVGSLKNDRIFTTGHYHGLLRRGLVRWEFHLTSRGFDQFVDKVKKLAVADTGDGTAVHWRGWLDIFQKEGEEGLRKIYDRFKTAGAANKGESDALVKLFKDCATSREDALKSVVRAPFSAGVVTASLQKQDGQPHPFSSPASEYDVLDRVFKRGFYDFPPVFEPSVVVDIGAHVGAFSAWIKERHPACNVICFEPVPATFQLLRANMTSYSNVTLVQAAVLDRDAQAKMFMHPVSSQLDSFVLRDDRAPSDFGVNIVAAATIPQRLNLQGIDILKISAEGAEAMIIRGFGEFLQRVRCVLAAYHSEEERKAIDAMLPGFFFVGASLERPGRGVLKYINRALAPQPQPRMPGAGTAPAA